MVEFLMNLPIFTLGMAYLIGCVFSSTVLYQFKSILMEETLLIILSILVWFVVFPLWVTHKLTVLFLEKAFLMER